MKNENKIKPLSLDLGSFVKNQIDIGVRADENIRKTLSAPLKQLEGLADVRGTSYGYSRDYVPSYDKKIQ